MATAKRLEVKTVAVYSEVDSEARHVRLADEAVCIGPAAAAESYLNISEILKAAKAVGADAVHPGYGFLAENADFAEAVRAAGLVFVGPPTQAIRDMGAKDNAKAIMAAAHVPIVPGYYGADQSHERLREAAREVGYPVLLKAALGGGGKGMRIVQRKADLGDAINSAKREALSAFGDDHLLVERYLTKTRHIEIQVFGDHQGNVVHLFERDCSLQRRHQKVIEEAPAPGMTAKLRAEMGAAAVAAARAVAYEGAGTVEFLLAPDNAFYFMEMNARLQVEHPVSEWITGLDFVEWQLRIADGEPLPLAQTDIKMTGHAVEARLYAEDPDHSFLPVPGRVGHLEWPAKTDRLRIDTGIDEGDNVSAYYDPMIAKVIGYGETRADAIAVLDQALRQTEIIGAGQNIRFLTYLLNSKPFLEGKADTSFVDSLSQSDFALSEDRKYSTLIAAAEHCFTSSGRRNVGETENQKDVNSPWRVCDGWRLGGETALHIRLDMDDTLYRVSKRNKSGRILYTINGAPWDMGAYADVRLLPCGSDLQAFDSQGPVGLVYCWPFDMVGSEGTSENAFLAPMPGKITVVNIASGDRVAAGDVLVVLEAMKMEHTITSPRSGVIETVFVKVGEQIDEGSELLAMEAN